MKSQSLLQITVDLDTEEKYYDLLLNTRNSTSNSIEISVIDSILPKTIAKIKELKELQRKLHKEHSEIVASLGLPTYRLPD